MQENRIINEGTGHQVDVRFAPTEAERRNQTLLGEQKLDSCRKIECVIEYAQIGICMYGVCYYGN